MFISMRGSQCDGVGAIDAAFPKIFCRLTAKKARKSGFRTKVRQKHPDEVAKCIRTVEIINHIGPLQRNQYACGG
jgi:hypothetical protein